jgi:catechol 2,3-dioxygenase-like lactoylglutathione lyase family enzyme
MLDHFTIKTSKVEMTAQFYEQSIGLYRGPRPQFSLPGAWMYNDDGHPILHLVSLSEGYTTEASVAYFRCKGDQSGTQTIGYIFFKGDHLASTQQHFVRQKIPFRERVIPEINVHQLFLDDPNGITIEITFPFSPDNKIVGTPLPVVDVI